MSEVNLKAVTEIFKRMAIRNDWCSDAEDIFIAATGVTPLPLTKERRPCPCGWAECDVAPLRMKPESRFTLPDDAPETVPEAPIIAALRSQEISVCDCVSCQEDVQEDRADLQAIADLLPSKPDIFALRA